MTSAPPTDDELWAEAVAGIQPIARSEPLPKKRATGASNWVDDDTEVLRELKALVDGRAVLDFSDSDEFIEGRAADCSRLDLQRLRNAEFAVQATLDLHGMNRDEARRALLRFFEASVSRGHRCVLVITGRGLRSPGRRPVLKEVLARWLVAGRLSNYALAFASAKVHDGGVGAAYVLLRRNPRRD